MKKGNGFQQMILEKLNVHVEENKKNFNSYIIPPHTHTENGS